MKRKELNCVKTALMRELDIALQHQCHQALNEVINDLRLRYVNVKPGSTPDDIFSILLSTGILKNFTNASIVEMRESIERLRSNTFGICLICGRDISLEMLVEHPTSRRCLQCERRILALHAAVTNHHVNT